MATITLAHPRRIAGTEARRMVGRITGNAYIVNGLGQVTVDVLDATHLRAEGWLPTLGGGINSGLVTLDFGAFPGSSMVTVTVKAVDANDPYAALDCFISPVATVDHSVDEQQIDPPLVTASADGNGNVVIVGVPSGRDLVVPDGVAFGSAAGSRMPLGQTQLMPVGKYSVGWAFHP